MIAQIHHGDWRDVFATWPTEAVVIIDPPYGVKHRRTQPTCWRGNSRFTHQPTDTSTPIIVNDHSTEERDEALERLAWVAAAVFGPRRIDRIRPWRDPREILILDKGEGVGVGDVSLPWKPCWESIAIYGEGWAGHRGSGILRGPKIAYQAGAAPNGRIHPNEKNLDVCRELVRKAPDGLPIIDPFMGSGTVGAAAMLEGRDYYGAELVRQYFDDAAARLGITHGPLFEEAT